MRYLLRSLLCVLVGVVSGCQSERTPPPITLGHVCSKSGTESITAKLSTDAIRLALEDINKNDKLAPIHVRHTDAQDKLQAFAAEAVRLVTVSDAVAIIGGATSSQVEQLDRSLAPVLGLCGMRTPIMSELAFLTDLSPECRGSVAAKYVVQELKVTYVLEIVDRRDEEANRVSAAFSSSIAKLYKRDEPLQHVTVAINGDGDITRAAERVEKTKPDAVVFAGKLATLTEMQRNLAHPVPVMLATAAPHDKHSTLPGEIYGIAAYALDDNVPSIRRFRSRFIDAFGEEPNDIAVLTYDAVRILAKVVRETPEYYKHEKLAEALLRVKDFPGITGPLSFDGQRQLRRPAFILRLGKNIVKRYDAEETLVVSKRG